MGNNVKTVGASGTKRTGGGKGGFIKVPLYLFGGSCVGLADGARLLYAVRLDEQGLEAAIGKAGPTRIRGNDGLARMSGCSLNSALSYVKALEGLGMAEVVHVNGSTLELDVAPPAETCRPGFVKLPKELMDPDGPYSGLTPSARLAYALLAARAALSARNPGYGGPGGPFFIYTRRQLADAMCSSPKRAGNAIGELVGAGLLTETYRDNARRSSPELRITGPSAGGRKPSNAADTGGPGRADRYDPADAPETARRPGPQTVGQGPSGADDPDGPDDMRENPENRPARPEKPSENDPLYRLRDIQRDLDTLSIRPSGEGPDGVIASVLCGLLIKASRALGDAIDANAALKEIIDSAVGALSGAMEPTAQNGGTTGIPVPSRPVPVVPDTAIEADVRSAAPGGPTDTPAATEGQTGAGPDAPMDIPAPSRPCDPDATCAPEPAVAADAPAGHPQVDQNTHAAPALAALAARTPSLRSGPQPAQRCVYPHGTVGAGEALEALAQPGLAGLDPLTVAASLFGAPDPDGDNPETRDLFIRSLAQALGQGTKAHGRWWDQGRLSSLILGRLAPYGSYDRSMAEMVMGEAILSYIGEGRVTHPVAYMASTAIEKLENCASRREAEKSPHYGETAGLNSRRGGVRHSARDTDGGHDYDMVAIEKMLMGED
jgi:hypothetical protein